MTPHRVQNVLLKKLLDDSRAKIQKEKNGLLFLRFAFLPASPPDMWIAFISVILQDNGKGDPHTEMIARLLQTPLKTSMAVCCRSDGRGGAPSNLRGMPVR
jgi:hypothetical protein